MIQPRWFEFLSLGVRIDFDPSQPRDEIGRWTDGTSKSKLVPGVHVGLGNNSAIKSEVSAERTAEILSVFSDAELRYLERANRLDAIEIKAGPFDYDGDEVEGLHYKNKITVAGSLDQKHWGDPLEPGDMFGVSDTAPTEIEAVQRVLVHELAHSFEKYHRDDILEASRSVYSKGKPISQYAKVSPSEYWAETYSAYRFIPDALKQCDPIGYALVEKVLAWDLLKE